MHHNSIASFDLTQNWKLELLSKGTTLSFQVRAADCPHMTKRRTLSLSNLASGGVGEWKVVWVQLHTALTIFGTDQLWWERSLIELVPTWLMVLSKIHKFQSKVRSAKIFSNKFQSKGRRREYLAGSSLVTKTSFEGSVHRAALCGWKLVDKLLRHSSRNS